LINSKTSPLPDSPAINEWSISNPEESEAEATEPTTAAVAKLASTEIVIIDTEDSDSQSCVVSHHLFFLSVTVVGFSAMKL
jgi:hypothetical protein